MFGMAVSRFASVLKSLIVRFGLQVNVKDFRTQKRVL